MRVNKSRTFIFHRWQDLDAIHRLKDEAGLNDKDYREMLEKQAGVSSAKHLTTLQRVQIIEHLNALKQERS